MEKKPHSEEIQEVGLPLGLQTQKIQAVMAMAVVVVAVENLPNLLRPIQKRKMRKLNAIMK
jgi:hypothetical protein